MYIGIGGIEKSVFGIPNTGFGHLKLLHTGRKHVGVISSANIWIIHKFRVEGATFNGKTLSTNSPRDLCIRDSVDHY